MKKVHYIGWYIAEKDIEHYSGNIPGMLKMRYITQKIVEAGKNPTIFSLANKNNGCFYKSFHTDDNGIPVLYSGGVHVSGRFSRELNNIVKELLLVVYCCFKVKREDTVVLYHSVAYSHLVTRLNRIIKRNVVLEVEEVYGYSATGDNKKSLESESYSIRNNNKFILINDYVASAYNIPDNKYVPCFGVVNIPQRKVERLNDGRIHVVYAGTIEGRKQGAYTAVEAAEYLPENYILHVLGFGKDVHIQMLKDKIEAINKNRKNPVVEYLGFKSGDELDDFLYSCHIGVSTYVMRDNFANMSLPSKILTYMCHDLAVVRNYASAYEDTEIAKYWAFYHDDSPQEISKAIVNVRIPEIGVNHDFLRKCDERVVGFIKNNC